MSKKLPIPSYEELFKLSNIDNFSLADLAKHYNTTTTTIKKWKKELNIPTKSKSSRVECNKNTVRRKYGVDYVSQVPEIRKKQKETCVIRYGTETPLLNKDCIELGKSTNLRKYGSEYYISSDIGRKTIEESCLSNNGYINPFKDKNWQINNLNSYKERTGYNNPLLNPTVIEKCKNTLLNKFGVDNYFKSDEFKHKNKEYYKYNFGVENQSQVQIPESTRYILFDKDRFINYIVESEDKSPKGISDSLNISPITLHKYSKLYDCENLFEYNVSSYENDIKNEFPNVFISSRSIIKPYEIDLYNDTHKIGIEFNGNYWHSELYKDKNYHKHKSDLALNSGVQLYHIFEYEWLNPVKKSIIKSQIGLKLGKSTRVYARNCEIKSVDSEESKVFLDNNHLQGSDNSSVKLGLYHSGELVCIMTFGKPRFNKSFEWELYRFCSKKGINVVGGASKLFKFFVHKYNPTSMLSYSNIAKTTGKLYGILGFNKERESSPNYVWVNRDKVLTRYQCQKHKLIKLGYDKSKSEDEIMHSRGYVKLYDCGNALWSQYFNKK